MRLTPVFASLLLCATTIGSVGALEHTGQPGEGAVPKGNVDEAVSDESVEREAGADEDPLAGQTQELHEKPGHIYREHTSLKPYGSLRYRYSEGDQESGFNDDGSRLGLSGELQYRPRFWLLGRAELGFKLFDTLQQLHQASGRLSKVDVDVSTRLAYAGISTPSTTAIYGKNWSSYYRVTGLTDRFAAFGGDASGTYNAQTDGGPTGTGRADSVLQGRFSIDTPPQWWGLEPFKLNLQVQQGEPIPQLDNIDYSHALGFSAILETTHEGFLGIAYNHAFVHDKDMAALESQGMDGDARALALGSRRFGDHYYVATTVSLLDNHETTDEGIYFDAWGWETFVSLEAAPRWWVVGGWNVLKARGDQPRAQEYRLRYGVLGLQYSIEQARRMIYAEIRLDDSRRADGSPPGNVYTLGVRWDFP